MHMKIFSGTIFILAKLSELSKDTDKGFNKIGNNNSSHSKSCVNQDDQKYCLQGIPFTENEYKGTGRCLNM